MRRSSWWRRGDGVHGRVRSNRRRRRHGRAHPGDCVNRDPVVARREPMSPELFTVAPLATTVGCGRPTSSAQVSTERARPPTRTCPRLLNTPLASRDRTPLRPATRLVALRSEARPTVGEPPRMAGTASFHIRPRQVRLQWDHHRAARECAPQPRDIDRRNSVFMSSIRCKAPRVEPRAFEREYRDQTVRNRSEGSATGPGRFDLRYEKAVNTACRAGGDPIRPPRRTRDASARNCC